MKPFTHVSLFVSLVLILNLAVFEGRARASHYVGIELYPLIPPSGLLGVFHGNSVPIASGEAVGSTHMPWYALRWDVNGNPINLHPFQMTNLHASMVEGTDGIHQVGYVETLPYIGLYPKHAFLWNGSAASAVDLHPTSLGFLESEALDVSGSQQVGWARDSAHLIPHALLWQGTPESVVDLHPVHFIDETGSLATATDGIQQVGVLTGSDHAVLWQGTPESAVDLHPVHLGFYKSRALGVGGGQQVGAVGYFGDLAVLWSGTPESAILLHPAQLEGVTSSYAYATDGVRQVGGIAFSGLDHAALWSGTADSVLDLHALLPPGYYSSQAFDIGPDGTIYGIARDLDFGLRAVKWVPMVPEPGSLLIVASAFIGICGANPRRFARQFGCQKLCHSGLE